MKYARISWTAATLALLCSCGGHGAPLAEARLPAMQAVDGTSLDGVRLTVEGDSFTISFAPAPETRSLLVTLPAAVTPGEAVWDGALDNVLAIAGPVDAGVEICLTPLADAKPQTVSVHVPMLSTLRSVAATPTGNIDVVDLDVSKSGRNDALLSWTQVIEGDGNFDGMVTASDIKYLAPYWLKTYNRSAPNANQTLIYWLDWSADGRIDSNDLNLVRKNLGFGIAGYRVECNGLLVQGAAGLPNLTVTQDESIRTPGLPSTFTHICPGKISDCWQIKPVGCGGRLFSGCVSGGGTIKITVEVTDDSGDEPRFSTRVIIPIEIIDNSDQPQLIPSTSDGPVTTVPNVGRGEIVLGQVELQSAGSVPVIGHGTSAIGKPEIGRIVCAVPMTVPYGVELLEVHLRIALETDALGHRLVRMTSTYSAAGLPNEISFVLLDLNTGELRRDTNCNGEFEDELVLHDTNRDGISDSLWSEIINLAQPKAPAPSMQVLGRAYGDSSSGLLNLTNVIGADATSRPPQYMALRIAENTRMGPYPASDALHNGDYVVATIHSIALGKGSRAYWASSLHLLGPNPPAAALRITDTRQWDGTILIRWPAGSSASQRIVRYSNPDFAYGPGGHLNFAAPGGATDWSVEQKLGTSFLDRSANWSGSYQYDVFAIASNREMVFLGSAN